MLFILFRKEEAITRKSVRPFSQYANENKYKNAHTEKENFGFADDGVNKSDNKTVMNGGSHSIHWYRDVVELRKKAEQYRVNLIHNLSLPLQLIHVGFFFRIVVGASKYIPICTTSKKTYGIRYRVAAHCLPSRWLHRFISQSRKRKRKLQTINEVHQLRLRSEMSAKCISSTINLFKMALYPAVLST